MAVTKEGGGKLVSVGVKLPLFGCLLAADAVDELVSRQCAMHHNRCLP